MIKLIFDFTTSNVDSNGNSYHFVRVTDTRTGCNVTSHADSISIYRVADAMSVPLDECYLVEKTVPIRQFNAQIKGLPCMSEQEIADYLRAARKTVAIVIKQQVNMGAKKPLFYKK